MLSLLPVVVAALATIPVGFLWYTVLFAKPWTAMHELNKRKKMTGPTWLPFAATILTSFVLAFMLALLFLLGRITTLQGALKLGLLVWFAFDFLPQLTRHLFSRRPLGLVLIDSGHQAANVMLISWILMSWRW